MATDIHASIRTFLQQQTIASLKEEGVEPSDRYTKAGVIPYIREDGFRYYVMKPRGERPELGAPSFQLCKGTRMHFVPNAGWRDMRAEGAVAAQKETLAETALREGIEELGLKLDNIARLTDCGPYNFSSATTGKPKQMWLFAAEVNDADDFAPEREIAIITEERRWVSAADFTVVGRPDHQPILGDIEAKLIRFHKE